MEVIVCFIFLLMLVLSAFCVIGIKSVNRRIDVLEENLKEQFEKKTSPVVIREEKFEPTPPAAAVVPPKAIEAPRPAVEVKKAPAPSAVKSYEYLREIFKRFRTQLTVEEWEAMVGGNWLNKIGILVLIIGVALFLGYSMAFMGPLGRILTGFAVSGVLWGGGVFLEKRTHYVVFARGLIGGGWAGIYFTTYAMSALEASQLIFDPLLAAATLFVVAILMIAHSLFYRSQIVTGLAYFIGFITLVLVPADVFSPLAMLILVVSLLLIAYRFAWDYMVAGGLLATYSLYAMKSVGLADGWELTFLEFLSQYSYILLCWLFFEAYDILSIKRRAKKLGVAHTLFPLNLCGLLGVSSLQWLPGSTANFSFALLVITTVYLASALARFFVKPPKGAESGEEIFNEMALGGFEGAVSAAVLFSVPLIFLRLEGLSVTIMLWLEAELLFLLGIIFRQPYLRFLSLGVFTLPFVKHLAIDKDLNTRANLISLAVEPWTLLGWLLATTFYFNRCLTLAGKKVKQFVAEEAYSYAAAVLVAIIILMTLPVAMVGVGLLFFALMLLAVGVRQELKEFRFQSYGFFWLGVLGVIANNLLLIGGHTFSGAATLLVYALVGYLITLRFILVPASRLPVLENRLIKDCSSGVATAALACAVWYFFPVPSIALGWGLISLALVELGIAVKCPTMRTQGSVMAGLTFGRLFVANFTGRGETWLISHRTIAVLPLIVMFYYLSARYREIKAQNGLEIFEKIFDRIYFYLPVILAFALLRFELGRILVVAGWAILGLGLMYLGVRWQNVDLRWQGYILAIIVFIRSWATNFNLPESFTGAVSRIEIGTLVILCLYLAALILPRFRHAQQQQKCMPKSLPGVLLCTFDLHGRMALSSMATLLLTILLFYEVAGSWLTVAWGIEAVLLLLVGFPLREKSLRLLGILLFMVCILKLFIFDFSELETVYRILSFIVLGILLLGVSWLYTRYRGQIKNALVEE